MTDPGRVVIIGAGPAGLGAAYRLAEHGHDAVTLLERAAGPGGLATSYVDDHGFTWDVGGHVQFSHYAYYDAVLDRALGDAWLHHQRESWVWIKGRFVPYPFQNNIHRLDPDDRARCLADLERAAAQAPQRPRDFGEWVDRTFGGGLATLFLVPYNQKVWGYPLARLGTRWMGERVAVPDVARIKANIADNRDDVGWGPNRTFRFPRRGGTGAIWRAVAGLLKPERMTFRAEVARIELAARVVVLTDGRRVPFDSLVSSMPLDRLCALTEGLPAWTARAADSLVHSAVHILGVGLRGTPPPALATKCWMYFPEANSPYYRVTVFSNYSPANVPPGAHWSLMAEVCETSWRPVDAASLADWTVRAMREDRLIPPDAEVVTVWHRREEHGYPTPFVGREAVVEPLRRELERHRIYSRGRFGAWLYEVSNQDHTFMQGVEVADRLSGAGGEPTLDTPDYVNSGALLRTAG